MGMPSATEPWGWQLDGHHLVINYFVLGDQVVMTPAFMGAEPASRDVRQVRRQRRHEGRAGRGPRADAIADARSSASAAIARRRNTGNTIWPRPFKDNLVLDYAGVRASYA